MPAFMNWKLHIEKLGKGETVQFRPVGNSMQPRIKSKELVTVSPCKTFEVDDIVLCKVRKNYYVHLVKAIQGNRYQIGNNHGGINGWIGTGSIYGKVTKVEP